MRFQVSSFPCAQCGKLSTRLDLSGDRKVEAGKCLYMLTSISCICLYWVLIQQDTFVVELKHGKFYTLVVSPPLSSVARFDISQSLMSDNLTCWHNESWYVTLMIGRFWEMKEDMAHNIRDKITMAFSNMLFPIKIIVKLC